MFPKSSGYRRTGNLIQIFDKDLAPNYGFQNILAGARDDVDDNRSESSAVQFVGTFKLTHLPHKLKVSDALCWFSIVGASDSIGGYLDIWGYKHQYLVKYWKQISGDNG